MSPRVRRRATQVVETPEDLPWVTGILVDDETGAVVGGAGFHAAPDADGMVEVGEQWDEEDGIETIFELPV